MAMVTSAHTKKTTISVNRRFQITGVQTGIVMALLAVIAGVFLEVRPPEAYGICTACHGRDLINSTLNSQLGTNLLVSPASLVFPLLTTVGMVGGGVLGALTSGEFRWSMPENPLITFVHGILVMNFALLAAGCSIRLLLRTAHGDSMGLVGFSTMVVGIICSTYFLKWRAER